MPIRYVDLFCGLGAFHQSFKKHGGFECVLACDVNYPTPKGIGLPVSASVALDYSQVLHQVHRLFP